MLMIPSPRLRVKKIWPAAVSQTSAFLSIEKSGFQMKAIPLVMLLAGRVGSGVPRVRTRMAKTMPKRKRRGMPILARTSIPLLIPL